MVLECSEKFTWSPGILLTFIVLNQAKICTDISWSNNVQKCLRLLLMCGCIGHGHYHQQPQVKYKQLKWIVLWLIRGVTRRDRLLNEDVRKELEVQSILDYIEQSQLHWHGHVIVKRMANGRTVQHWLQWTPQTTRPCVGDAGWTSSSKPWRDPGELPCRTLSRHSCSSTDKNGDTSSLTDLRPTWILVQGTVS